MAVCGSAIKAESTDPDRASAGEPICRVFDNGCAEPAQASGAGASATVQRCEGTISINQESAEINQGGSK